MKTYNQSELDFHTAIKMQAVGKNFFSLPSGSFLQPAKTTQSTEAVQQAELGQAAPSNGRAVSLLGTFSPIYRTKEKK
jgi:hypothetical protein